MRNQLIGYAIALYVLCAATTLQAQVGTQLPNLTVTDMQDDYDLLRAALEEAHGSIYRFSSKAAIDKQFDLHRKKISYLEKGQDFMILLSKMLAQLRDGHMRLEYDDSTVAELARARLLPLRISIEGNRLVVMYNDSPTDSTIRPGMEILSINDRKSNDLVQSMLPNLSGDGYIETGKIRRLERTFAQHYWLFINRAATYTIKAKDSNGNVVTSTLSGILAGERETNRSTNPVNALIRNTMMRVDGTKENLSLLFIQGGDIACMRIRTFDDLQLAKRIDTAFQTLADKKAKALILDLRGNIGGIDEHGAWLVSYLTSKPFRYFDRIHLSSIRPAFNTWKPATIDNLRAGTVADPRGGYLVTPTLHTGVALQQPGPFPFTGKLIVLMDGGTFSTAADVTAQLRHLTSAIFIGEECGGTMEGNTSGLNALIKLPHSKMGVKIHMYAYWNAVSPIDKGRGTKPDHQIDRRVSDLLRGMDLPMNKAMDLAKASLGSAVK